MEKTKPAPPVNGGMTCSECKHLRVRGTPMCVRLPPIPIGGITLDAMGQPNLSSMTMFPSINAPDEIWCGEFKQKAGT